ncbi:trypsin-1 isoform X3 [Anabrus simplex]|uniref:trypsin-1 isoform X3 n=1 Tax=Anabrus simplex TaxID=316456 RepID=UPI0035A2D9FF
MLRLQILINLLGFCFANTPESGRIVGGEFADIKDFPYQVSYHYQGVIMCGASIIGKEWVLTAAHCVNGISPGDVTLRAGTSSHSEGGLVYKVTDIVKHDRYSHEDFDNDIALAKEGKGNFSPNLREVKVPVMNHDKCVKDYNGTVTKNMLCAGYDEGMKDACQVAYLYHGVLMCGASIIDKEWVLTAAHCVEDMSPDVVKIRAGSSSHSDGGSVHQVVEIVQHKEYSKSGMDNDIALAKVKPPFKFSDTVKAIKLNDKAVKEGTTAKVSGWGVTSGKGDDVSPALREVKVPVMDHDKCVKYYHGSVTKNMLCAGYDEGKKDACQGDSGGPLAADGKLIGVVSFGHGCAEPKSPGVYTDVSVYREWIKKNAGV